MTKRILTLLLVLVLALSLCACSSIKDLFGGTSDDPGAQDVDPNAPAHEQLMTEVNNRLVWAAEQEDVGMTLQSNSIGKHCHIINNTSKALQYSLKAWMKNWFTTS